LRHAPPLTRCLAAVDYAYPWDELIARFKFRDETAWASTFARIMHQNSGIAQAVQEADQVLAVPLSRQRLQERGYNQAALLGRALAPTKPGATVLLRIQHSPPQRLGSRTQRLQQVRHAFMVEPGQAGQLAGQRVLLIDDVMTSGATLFEAARTLLQAGARQVDAAVFARTTND
jgi:ComF family protein